MSKRQIQQFLFMHFQLTSFFLSGQCCLVSWLLIQLWSCASTKPPVQQASLSSEMHSKRQACLLLKQAQRVACLFEQYQSSNWRPKSELLVIYKDEYLSLLDLYHHDRSKHRLKSEMKLLIYAKHLSSTVPSLLQLLPMGIPLSYESYDSRSFQLKESKNQPSWHEITLHDHRLIWLEIQLSKPIPEQFFWDKIPFFHLIPVFYQAFELQIPKKQSIFYLSHDLIFSQFHQNTMNDTLLRWEKEKQLAYQKNELYLSSFQHWEEISDFLRGLYFKDIKPLSTISQTQPHVIGSESYFKLKEAIHQKFISLKKEYQYDKEYIYELSKVPLNTLYQPKALKNTIHDKKGDCKALTNLAIFELDQLLKSKFKKIPVSLAIGLTHDKMVPKESKSFPSLSWFNHIFLMININQQELIYFDLTAEKLDSAKLKHKRIFVVDQQQSFWLD